MRSSSGLQRKTGLKPGKGFKRPERKPQVKEPLRPATRRATYAGTAVPGAAPKDEPVVCEEYRKLVRLLPCIRCGIQGYTQFCHSDLGKGMGLKTDDRRSWPGCGPHPGPDGQLVNGCHHDVGREMTREERRAFEEDAGARTREVVRQAGLWPVKLPPWPGE